MKKILSIVASFFLLAQTSVLAEAGFGITLNVSTMDTGGSETLRDSSEVTNGSHSEDIVIPELFLEYIGESGAFGVAYIPVQELGTKSRSDTSTSGDGQDTGTYKADAEVAGHLMIYGDLNMAEVSGATVYGKLGLSLVDIETNESLNSGSTLPDEERLLGWTVGIGARGDMPFLSDSYFYKAEITYSEYDQFKKTTSGGNKIVADTDVTSAKFSIGYKY